MRDQGETAKKCPSCTQEFQTEDSLVDHWNNVHKPTEGDLVEEVFGCPSCGERRMDRLMWLAEDSEHVECQSCCYVYEP